MTNVFGKTLSGSRSLYVDDLTIGTVSITQNYSTVPYQLQLPPTQGIPNSLLTNNGSGLLTWRDETALPYVEEVGISVPSFLTVTNSPIIPTSLSPIISITADSTGTGAVVLQTAPTFLTSITTPRINNPSPGLDLEIAATGSFSDVIISSANGNLQFIAPSIFIGGNKYPTTAGNDQNVLETDGIGNLSWSATTGNGHVVRANNATMDGLTLTTPLEITSGGTGLDTIGPSGTVLTSNGTSLEWSSSNLNLLGVMRYKQTYFNPNEDPPPPDAQLWAGYAKIDLRTLYPVAGAQYGLALTYGYEANFGRFVNDYDFAVKVEIQYSLARFAAAIPVFVLPGIIPYATQLESFMAFFSTIFTGQSLFWIEKNDDGDVLAAQGGSGGSICSGSFTLILYPGDFFQFRGYNNAAGDAQIGNECEVSMNITSLAGVAGYLPPAPGTGTVDSVNIDTSNSFLSTGGGPITTTGTLTVGLSGSALPTANGGTGLTTVGTAGQVLTSNGTTLSYTTPTVGTITSVSASTPLASSGGATPNISFTGTLPVANGGTGVTASTGTGAVVLNTNPSFGVINTPYIEGSDSFGDIKINSTRYIYLDADNATVIGSNNYPNSTGSVGQVLYTNGGGTLFWATPPGGGVGGGTVTSVGLTSSNAFITVGGTSPIIGAGLYTLNIGTLPVLNGGTGTTTSTGTGSVVLSVSPTMTGALTIPQITGSGGGFGDLTLASARNIYLNAATSVTIGSNAYPTVVGAVGQILVTNGAPGVVSWSGSPTLTEITGSGGGFGDLTLTSARNIYLNAATSVVIGSNTYPVAVGSAGQVLTTNGAPGIVTWQTPGPIRGSAMNNGSVAFDSGNATYKAPSYITRTGSYLSYSAVTGRFTNDTGATILVTASYSLAYAGISADPTTFWIELNGADTVTTSFGKNKVAPRDWSSGCSTFVLPPNEFFAFVGNIAASSGGSYDPGSTATYTFISI